MSLERIRDRATAKKPVVREKHRLSHSQGASGENPRQNHCQRVSGEKKEVKQHGYEDSEKYIEATMRSQSSAQSSGRGETMKRTEKSKANGRQEKSKANGRQTKPKDCDRDKASYEVKYTVQSKAAATHPTSDADVQQQSIASPRCPAGAIRAEALRRDHDYPKD